MAGSWLAVILIPVVAFAALGIWLSAVMYASRHPSGKDSGRRPRWQVTGAAFRGDPRQVAPHRDATPSKSPGYQSEEQRSR